MRELLEKGSKDDIDKNRIRKKDYYIDKIVFFGREIERMEADRDWEIMNKEQARIYNKYLLLE